MSIPVKRFPEKPNSLRRNAFRRELRHAISAMLRPAVIFDLPPTTKLDGPAIDFLIQCALAAAAHDAEIAVAAASPEHRVLLEVTRLSCLLPAFRSIEEAIAHLEKFGKPAAEKFSQSPGGSSVPMLGL
ncbi:MAG: STAS domain-containing protein [Terriglobales bacterium]